MIGIAVLLSEQIREHSRTLITGRAVRFGRLNEYSPNCLSIIFGGDLFTSTLHLVNGTDTHIHTHTAT